MLDEVYINEQVIKFINEGYEVEVIGANLSPERIIKGLQELNLLLVSCQPPTVAPKAIAYKLREELINGFYRAKKGIQKPDAIYYSSLGNLMEFNPKLKYVEIKPGVYQAFPPLIPPKEVIEEVEEI